jgi:5-methylcytosine-specific restriction protein B
MGLLDSDITEEQRNALWNEFLNRWPASKLPDMSLEQYTAVGSQETFTYWLESKTESLGSVWGGSAFKFGVFRRKDQKQKASAVGRSYSRDYGWYSKYGGRPEVAFDTVRELICTIARAAREGGLDVIEEIDLGTAIKWKIAFLYQDRADPLILPVFKKSHIRAFLGHDSTSQSMSELQAEVSRRRSQARLFEFAARVWKEGGERLKAGLLTAEHAFEYLSERFDVPKEPSKKLAGFVTDAGKELVLERDRQPVTLYLSEGNWQRAGVKVIRGYSADEPRNINIDSYAPTLGEGNPAFRVEVQSMEGLTSLCDEYDGTSAPLMTGAKGLVAAEIPLNQILYGPPGTGKTYHAITEALRILDPNFLDRHAGDRSALKSRFDELVKQKRARLVTFHQSFSYEDFVEGIRATTNESNPSAVTYPVERGVFTEMCEAARLSVTTDSSPVRTDARVWKLSIGRRSEQRLRDECFRRGEARVGWGYVGDLSNANRPKRERDAFDAESGTNQHSLMTFAEDVSIGDILLCLKSATSIAAVGVVVGDYIFDSSEEDLWRGYFHKRAVKWLATGLDVDISELNGGSALTQKAIYELRRISPADALSLAGELKSGEGDVLPHVLIIDEINRANVSKVFGELITLIEPSKRAGATEALEVILPYSKKPFSVPGNLYLIGTMNTADRSLATLDIALRRRFDFLEMSPDPETLSGILLQSIDISKLLRVMNQRIEVLLDRDHALGHAYLLPLKSDPSLARLACIFRKQILPLLQEYFFEDWERIRWVLNDHRKQKDEHKFIVPPQYRIGELIGEGAGIPTEARQWRINYSALEHPESFLGIIGL